MKVVLIIPSLRPHKEFPRLIQEFKQVGFQEIIVVNDGSPEEYNDTFSEVDQIDGCVVLQHMVNLGKGRGLKTAFNYFLAQYPDYIGVVTADADGQHTPEDTYLVAKRLVEKPESLILGVRDFTGEDVPAKSKLGNRTMCTAFRLFVGLRIKDTQTGLRGISRSFLQPLMNLSGERYEYETNMLIETKKHQIPIEEVVIQTIYMNNNEGTHFNPIKDSLKVLSLIFKFALVSIASFVLDIGIFTILMNTIFKGLEQNLLYSTVGARVVSSLFNYACNKNIVFENNENKKATVVKYYILCIIQTGLSWGLLKLVSNHLTAHVTLIKGLVDTILFFISFQIQRELVFKKRRKSNE